MRMIIRSVSPRQPSTVLRLPLVLDAAWARVGPGPDGWTWQEGEIVRVEGEAGPPSRVEPGALVALACWAAWVRAHGGEVQVDSSLQSPYTWRSGLLRALVEDSPWSDELAPTERWVSLCRVAGEQRTRTLVDHVLPLLHLATPRARQAVGSAIKELAYNAKEHAHATISPTFSAGWFVGDRRVSFAFADTGIGIRQNLQRKGLITDDDTDRTAIERALQPGLTGGGEVGVSTAPNNAGMGLHITRCYAQGCRGRMWIASGTGRFSENGLGTEQYACDRPWMGTLVMVDLYPDSLGSFPSLSNADGRFCRLIRSGDAPKPDLVISPPVSVIGFADDKDWYIEQRPALRDRLQRGLQVQVDFGRAEYSTHSALNALLGEPLRDLGPDAARLIWVRNLRGPIERVFYVVIEDALHQHELRQHD